MHLKQLHPKLPSQIFSWPLLELVNNFIVLKRGRIKQRTFNISTLVLTDDFIPSIYRYV